VEKNVKIKNPGDDPYNDTHEPNTGPKYSPGEVVTKEKFQEQEDARKAKREALEKDPTTTPALVVPPEKEEVTPATGETVYTNVILLPHMKYTLPLLLAALSLWFAWRLINWPTFADFLIATDAELHKVSWTTRQRLVQDTIVVLVTVILMALF